MLELISSVLIALEKVKARTSRREQYSISLLRQTAPYLYSIFHRVGLYDSRNNALESLYDFLIIKP